MAVTVAEAHSPVRPQASLASVERYGDEVRESYLDRLDKLTFRVDDGNCEHRFFENGRVDSVKQVLENHSEHLRVVKYAMRSDGCIEYTRSIDKESRGQLLVATFDQRTDGITCISIALKAHQSLEIGCDSAQSLIREKSLFVAVKLNPDLAVGKFYELYQDQDRRELRITMREDDFGKRQHQSFSNDVPTDDPRYEAAKIVVMGAVKTIVDLERELFVNLFPFVAGETNEQMIEKQKLRLYSLAGSLFTAFDEASLAS